MTNLSGDIVQAIARTIGPAEAAIPLHEPEFGVADEAAVLEFSTYLFAPIDRFIRSSRRIKVLDVLTRAGISIEL